MEFASIYSLVHIFHLHGIKDVIISPGSRSAPLTLSFARHQGFNTYIIPDERSSSYVALGISLTSEKPVVLVCTSGTAAYNFGSAVAEAFYQKIPLIVLTADRPPEWIDQADGQSIHQSAIFGKNAKWHADIPVDLSHPDAQWHAERLISEGLNAASASPAGPVHFNFPFREPLFPGTMIETGNIKKGEITLLSKIKTDLRDEEWGSLMQTWGKCRNILIIPGQGRLDSGLVNLLRDSALHFKIPVTSDIISNMNGEGDPFIYRHDLFLKNNPEEMSADFNPDLVISFGNSILSKNLKNLLRKTKPANHWHLGESVQAPDTFQALTRILPVDPAGFFKKIKAEFDNKNINLSFSETWATKEKQTGKILDTFFPGQPFGELEVVRLILEFLPAACNLHLANSLPVRLANFSGLKKTGIEVFSNRGTSGIDGCVSTSVGVSMNSDKLNVLITGDMAFFYDRNALWHNYKIPNLRIIILNNHGGGIFRMIEGLNELPELDEYFETRQPLTAEHTAKDFNIRYLKADSTELLKKILPGFMKKDGQACILEIPTDSKLNFSIFRKLKSEIQKIWN